MKLQRPTAVCRKYFQSQDLFVGGHGWIHVYSLTWDHHDPAGKAWHRLTLRSSRCTECRHDSFRSAYNEDGMPCGGSSTWLRHVTTQQGVCATPRRTFWIEVCIRLMSLKPPLLQTVFGPAAREASLKSLPHDVDYRAFLVAITAYRGVHFFM